MRNPTNTYVSVTDPESDGGFDDVAVMHAECARRAEGELRRRLEIEPVDDVPYWLCEYQGCLFDGVIRAARS